VSAPDRHPARDRVLVVDDDPHVAASVRRSLEYAGYLVTVAHDGPAAIAARDNFAPARDIKLLVLQ
jgi:DNA-binding response OmpR family regulator